MKSITVLLALALAATSMAQSLSACEKLCVPQCGGKTIYGAACRTDDNGKLVTTYCGCATSRRARSVVSPLLNRAFGEDPGVACDSKCAPKCPSGQIPSRTTCEGDKLTLCECQPKGGVRRSAPVSPLVNREGDPCDNKCAAQCPKGQSPSYVACDGENLTSCDCAPSGGVRRSAPVSPLVTRALSVKECEKRCDNKCAADGEGKGSNASCTTGQLVTCDCVS